MTSVEPGDEAEQVTAPEDVILAARHVLRLSYRERMHRENYRWAELDWRFREGEEGQRNGEFSIWTPQPFVLQRARRKWEADAKRDQDVVLEIRKHPRHPAASVPGSYYGTAIPEARSMWEEFLALHPGDPVISMFAALFHSTWFAQRGHEILDECERLGGERLQILFCRAAQHSRPADPREYAHGPDGEWRKALAFLEEARALCGDSLRERRLKACALEDCMALHTSLEEWPEARHCGELLVALGGDDCSRLREQVRHAHQRLGLLHLIRGEVGFDPAAARACLWDAAAMIGADDAPPSHLDWALADALFREGRTGAVIEYLMTCRDAWPERAARLKRWISSLQAGKAPELWSFCRDVHFPTPPAGLKKTNWVLAVLSALGILLVAFVYFPLQFLVHVLRSVLPGRRWHLYRANRALQRRDFVAAAEQVEVLIRKATAGGSPLKRREHLVLGHILRGRTRLGVGRVDEAKEDLLAAGRIGFTHWCDSHVEPDQVLAWGLWTAGEKDAVIDYFALWGQLGFIVRRSNDWIASMEGKPGASGSATSDSASDRSSDETETHTSQ